jgi:histidinol-phosphate aminotransferase
VLDSKTQDLTAVLDRIRPAVRSQKPYHVGGIQDPPVKLNQNESPFDLPEDLKREIVDGFLAVPFNRYPKEQPDRLAEEFASFVGWMPGGVLVGNGSNDLTYTLGLALIEKGTPIVMPRPMFALYTTVVRLHEGDLIEIPSRKDHSFDADAILRAVREHAPALTVLATPNNPTGLAMSFGEIESIVDAASGFVLVDEAYADFIEAPGGITLLERYPNVIVLRTLSKAWGLAGLRLGFMLARPEVIAEILKARLPFMVDALAEQTALALLQRPEMLAERARQMKESCAVLTRALQNMDEIEVIPSKTNFVLFRTSVEPSKLMNRLAESGVLVRNMAGYPELHGFLRVNAGTEIENNTFLVALQNSLPDRD